MFSMDITVFIASSAQIVSRRRFEVIVDKVQQIIHLAITERHLGKPQTTPLTHITHCLDDLRQDILCHADDTPRWTANNSNPESGIGQNRQCRDWAELHMWAHKNSACKRRLVRGEDIDQIERFKFCAPDSIFYRG